MPYELLMRWRQFYDAAPWGGDVEDCRAEVNRIRWLLAEYGDESAELPEWQWPYGKKEQRDPREIIKDMRERELRRREELKRNNANGNSSTAIDATAMQSDADDIRLWSGPGGDPGVCGID
jgi:hypothetical protein